MHRSSYISSNTPYGLSAAPRTVGACKVPAVPKHRTKARMSVRHEFRNEPETFKNAKPWRAREHGRAQAAMRSERKGNRVRYREDRTMHRCHTNPHTSFYLLPHACANKH
jgi:hypothetical protein